MKKQVLALAFLGLSISPFATMQASISDQDLQKMSANKMENKALSNLQSFVAACALITTVLTGAGVKVTAESLAKNDGDASGLATITAVFGAMTAAELVGWYKIFAKRAERHGYKNDKLKFFFVDLMSSMEGSSSAHVHVIV